MTSTAIDLPAGPADVAQPYRLAPPAPPTPGYMAPDGAPDDLRELLQALHLEVPDLLAGYDPAAVGVVLVHPGSGVEVPDARGCIVASVHPLAQVQASAQEAGVSLGLDPKPGHFFAVLLGCEGPPWCWYLPPSSPPSPATACPSAPSQDQADSPDGCAVLPRRPGCSARRGGVAASSSPRPRGRHLRLVHSAPTLRRPTPITPRPVFRGAPPDAAG